MSNPIRFRIPKAIAISSLFALVAFPVLVSNSARAQSIPISIESTPPGALVFLDSPDKTLGPTPIQSARVTAGPHTLIFKLQGYKEARLPIVVEKRKEIFYVKLNAVALVSVSAGNDISTGASVKIDGKSVGVVPYQDNVEAGRHSITISRDGFKDYSQTFDAAAGQTVNITATLERNAPQGGSLQVVTNVPYATVKLDGEIIGPSPITKDGLAPGDHFVEAVVEGYQSAQETVRVEVGQQKVVSLTLKSTSALPGRIRVHASVRTASIFIDDKDQGNPPIVLEGIAPGPHTVAVKAAGYEDYKTTCNVSGATPCELNVELLRVGTPVRVKANTHPAELYLDDKLVGPVPFEGKLPAGAHRLEVRASGFETYVAQVDLLPSQTPRDFDVLLYRHGQGEGMTDEERSHLKDAVERAKFTAVSHAATPIPVGQALIDISTGWPYLFDFRMSTGLWKQHDTAIDAGVAIRTFFRLTDFEGRAKLSQQFAKNFSLAAQARAGGGLGPSNNGHPTNALFLSLEGLASLNVGDRGAATIYFAADFNSDRWDFEGSDSRVLVPTAGQRQNMARARMGGALDLVINREWNMFGLLEGILAGPDGGRRILGDIFGFGSPDTQIYFKLGVTRKF